MLDAESRVMVPKNHTKIQNRGPRRCEDAATTPMPPGGKKAPGSSKYLFRSQRIGRHPIFLRHIIAGGHLDPDGTTISGTRTQVQNRYER